MLWAFARENGIPFSKYVGKVSLFYRLRLLLRLLG